MKRFIFNVHNVQYFFWSENALNLHQKELTETNLYMNKELIENNLCVLLMIPKMNHQTWERSIFVAYFTDTQPIIVRY